MEAGLKYIIKTATDKLGVEVSVRKAAGKQWTGATQFVSDKERNKTYFRFMYCGTEYHAAITGADEVAENYAFLLSALIENAASAEISLGMNDYLRRIVSGDCSKVQVQTFHMRFNVPEIPCYTIVLEFPKNRGEDVLNVLESYSESTLDTPLSAGDDRYIFVKFIESPQEEYRSPGEFAEYLSRSLYEEFGITAEIGVGMVARKLEEINASYRQALDALKMSRVFNSKGNVHTYKEYMLVKIMEEVPRSKLQEYFDNLLGEDGKAALGDAEMVKTAEEFLGNSFNVAETARALYMHRNTLIYRLDKLEKETGLNIKNFSDAVTFRVITILERILGQ